MNFRDYAGEILLLAIGHNDFRAATLFIILCRFVPLSYTAVKTIKMIGIIGDS